jgi:hypothetical protein
MGNLWPSREQATKALADKQPEVLQVLDAVFVLVDDCAHALHTTDSPFARVSAVVLVKARNLALGCYSLSLDSLAQEAGALFRPLVEAFELLTYLRLDPERVDEVLDGRLPSAGEIAKRIQGHYKRLREYLSKNASHLSLTPESMRHILSLDAERQQVELRTEQPFRLEVVLRNLQVLFALFAQVAIEAANCTVMAGCPAQSEISDRVDRLRTRGMRVFEAALGSPQA